MSEHDEHFCRKPLGPWIAGLIVTTVMFVVWTVLKKEEIIKGMEVENKEPIPPPPTQNSNGVGPRFPNPVSPVAFQSTPYQPAAITKATPNGGMQLVAAVGAPTMDSRFQSSLKDAVNKIMPSTCDIHARQVANPPANPVDPQNFDFVPAGTGTIDKFIGNVGFENIGAGVIVDGRGYVLTNYHVTKDANDIVVTIFGNPSRDVRADVVANAPNLDLSLLKVRADGPFPEAQLGDSNWTQVGDYVVAVGSPFGIEQTVTSGIISGIRKAVMIEGLRYENLFQTDAAINHGSSGGPLVNLNGEVIAINTAIYAPTGVFNGTGFSIPINDCKVFLSQALQRDFPVPQAPAGMTPGELPPTNFIPANPTPVHFGLEVLPVNEVIAKQFNVPEQGVLVNRVIDELPASLAGIKRGDIITSIAGYPIQTAEDIRNVITRFHLGDNVNVNVLRNGVIDEIFVRLQ